MTQVQSVPPPVDLTVTHCPVDTGPRTLESVQQKGREVTVTFARQRTVLIALSTVHAQQLREAVQYFGWSSWSAPEVPPQDFLWKAIFDSKLRAFKGLYRLPAERKEPVAIRPSSPCPITPAMWEMVEKSQSVVLCCGLSGDLESNEIGSAAERGELCAVLAEAWIGLTTPAP